MTENCASLNGPAGEWLPEGSKIWLQMEDHLRSAGKLLLSQGATEETDRRQAVLAVDIQDIQQTLSGDGDAYARLVARYQGEIGKWLWRVSPGCTGWGEVGPSGVVGGDLRFFP